MSTFTEFNLDQNINKVLEEIGYTNPTPIQTQAIPIVLQGRDVLASAQTGTGKTAAFMLPALHKLCDAEFRGTSGPQVLVLVPTRELAMQVAEETKKFSKHMSRVKTVCIYGGVPYPLQKKALSTKYEILVATPGRLIDHMHQGRIDLSHVKMFILDEADRMLDMGFLEAVEEISNAIPETRQTLLFSATIDKKIIPVSRQLQHEPHEIRVQASLERQNAIEQKLYFVDNIAHKMRILDHLLENTEINQSIVFTSTIRQAAELSEQLQDKGYRSEALHGDMNQRQRSRTIEQLRQGRIQFLVATDVAARGIDVSTVTHVINFDLPFVAEDFVHRIGRTGRAGAKGTAITFATFKEKFRIANISKILGKQIEAHTIPGMEPVQQEKRSFAPRDRRDSRPFPSRGGFRGDREASFSRGPREGGFRADREASFSRGPREGGFRGDRDASFSREPREGGFGSRAPKPYKSFSDARSDSPFQRKEGGKSFPSAFGAPKKKTQWKKTSN
ncbi:MAG: DEAD/DEAH box helicase [Chlamydiia bacterium]|nr:DEAD/DEAH box helicase [Chlamydiia bacterium]